MQRTLLRTSLALVIALAGAVAADAHGTKVDRQIHIGALSKKTQKAVRHLGIAGPTLELVGTPDLAGSVEQGLSLYRAPWAKGGTCVSGVTAGIVDGADCDHAMFTKTLPGYATAGLFGVTPTGPSAPATGTGTGGSTPTPILQPHTLRILQVYGVATTAVRSAR
jgi:hypothetical protein